MRRLNTRWRPICHSPVGCRITSGGITMPQQTILVVEDKKQELLLLTAILENNGYQVVGATNGTDALARFKSVHPDLILLDLGLSPTGPQGMDVLREIRRQNDSIPIIIVS